MTYRGHTNRSRSDAELARILAPRCCLCSSQCPVAEEPAAWSISKLRVLEALPAGLRQSIMAKVKQSDEQRYICGECYMREAD